jgi:hypothetical protein
LCIKKTVPESKEWLREIGLNTPALVMDVVVGSIVGGEMLQGVPGEGIAAMIVNCLNGGAGKEPHALADGHSGRQERNARPSCVEKKSLEGMVVQSTERVWDV